jgi:hypothetical protein
LAFGCVAWTSILTAFDFRRALAWMLGIVLDGGRFLGEVP